ELYSVCLLVENYEREYCNGVVIPFNFNDPQLNFQLSNVPEDIKNFTWEFRSRDGTIYDRVTYEHGSYTLDYALFEEYPASGDIFELVVYYGDKTFKADLEFTFSYISLSYLDSILNSSSYNEILDLLKLEENRLLVANDPQHLNTLQNRLNGYEFGYIAGLLMLEVLEGVNEKEAVKLQALNVLGTMLSNKSVARSLLDEQLKVVIIPRDKTLTDMESSEFIPFLGEKYKKYRGLFTNRDIFTAIVAEEDILGGNCTARGLKDRSRKPGQSILVHEMIHAIHHLVLSEEETNTILSAFHYTTLDDKASETCDYHWIVGNIEDEEGPYSSESEREFFARLSEAHLGVSKSESPTGLKGKEAVREYHSEIYEIIRRLFGDITLKGVVAP